ncbi:AMP-binding protein [Pseudonocardia sp. C8]|uniref:class I adenylate-forming enzyme family protein n=1 Tax=Pseudonocardia sp. C8 TaxID=2762759 RepID=UPI0016429259|nr:AMP-binding protein [Pseudonocardia sp. C8]
MGFHELLISACEQAPDRTLVHGEDGSTSFAEHLSRVARTAGFLRSGIGLGRTDRFAVLSRNSSDYLELFHTALVGAAVIVPLNVRSSELELMGVLNDSGCRVCFASAEFVALANRLRERTGLEEVIEIGPGCEAGGFRDRRDAAKPRMPAAPDPQDTAFIMYTSGTTGSAKGVVIQHGALANDIYKTAVPTNLTQGYTFLLHAPLFHIASVRGFGLATAAGSTLVLLPRFDPRRIVDAIKAYHVTTTGFIASTVRDMLDIPEFRGDLLPSLTCISYGSAPMSPSVLQRLMEAFPNAEFVNWYGLTETCGHVCALTGEDHRKGGARLMSVGRPLPGNRVRIVDQHGRVQPRGISGEIAVAGDNLMAGYWNQPEIEADRDGSKWFRTGDAGYLDSAGYVYLAGRARDMIITGGENVVPAEVEAVLTDYPQVSQAVVMGVPDEKWGEAVHACVSVQEGAEVSESELRAHCRRRVAGYKVPKRIDIRSEPFPMTGSHKIDRKQLIGEYRDRIAAQYSQA